MKICLINKFNSISEDEEKLILAILARQKSGCELTFLNLNENSDEKNGVLFNIIKNFLSFHNIQLDFNIKNISDIKINLLNRNFDMIYISKKSHFKLKNNDKVVYYDETNSIYKDSLEIFNSSINTLNFILNNEYLIYNDIFKFESKKRIIHSISVANLAYQIAVANKLTCSKLCYICGVFHDIAKDIKDEKQKELIEKYYSKYLSLNKVIYHQFLGAFILKKYFKIRNRSILKGILYHTTGNKHMSKIAKIIYSADKIEPGRGYDSSYMINECLKNYKTGFKLVLKESIIFYKINKIDYKNKLTLNCINNYLKGENYDYNIQDKQN